MAQLKRTARSRAVPRVGYARRGVIHTVPDDLVDELLATGEWQRVGEPNGAAAPNLSTFTVPAGAPEPERVTEPAPSKPAAKPRARPRKRKK